MIRRLGIFSIGFFLGVLFLSFVFPGRFSEMTRYFSLDYRVIYHLDKDTVYMSPEAQYHLRCLGLEQEDVLKVLEGGKVNFKKSDKKAFPCKLYTIERDDLSVFFELCNEKVKVQNFSFKIDTCN